MSGGDLVDFGLPSGNLWPKGNLVSDGNGGYKLGKETDYGAYFQWGGTTELPTSGRISPTLETIFNNSGANTVYPLAENLPRNQKFASAYSPSSGFDIAHISLGKNYRMPSVWDFCELLTNTDNEYTTIDGVYGLKVMKKNNHSVYIFFPSSGHVSTNWNNEVKTDLIGANQSNINRSTYYNTSSVVSERDSFHMYANLGTSTNTFTERYVCNTTNANTIHGLPVRPVWGPTPYMNSDNKISSIEHPRMYSGNYRISGDIIVTAYDDGDGDVNGTYHYSLYSTDGAIEATETIDTLDVYQSGMKILTNSTEETTYYSASGRDADLIVEGTGYYDEYGHGGFDFTWSIYRNGQWEVIDEESQDSLSDYEYGNGWAAEISMDYVWHYSHNFSSYPPDDISSNVSLYFTNA